MDSSLDFFENFTLWSLLVVPAALLAIMVHEICHGLVAYALGDPTAKERKRLSFNPIRHVDPFGLLMLIVVGFGWAKPVPVDTRYFKRPKLGMALVALAGPVSNFILAFICVVCVRISIEFSGIGAVIAFQFFSLTAIRSTGLGIFNLFPIPPLDGSKIIGAVLPDWIYYKLMQVERFGFLLLMGLLWTGLLDTPLSWLLVNILDVFYGLFNLVIPEMLQAYLENLLEAAVLPAELFEYMKIFITGG